MKLSILTILAATAATTTEAFAPLSGSHQTRTSMRMSRVDSADLVKDALEISKKFGPSSKEAQLAWEAVEEVDSSDNSAAMKGSLADDCEIDNVDPACLEYNSKLEELNKMITAQQAQTMALKTTVTQVKDIKLTVPETKAAPASDKLQTALAEAKALTEEKGITSPEARVAWESVEEIAAADNSGALGGSLSSDECLVDAAQAACEALDELSRIMAERS